MRGKPVSLADFGGGVDLTNDPREIGLNVASDLLNVVAGSNGRSFKSRAQPLASGYTLSSGSDVDHIVNGQNTTGFLYATANGRLFRTGATALYTPGGSPIGRGWSITRGYLGTSTLWLFMHPFETAQVWNGVTATTASWSTAGGLPTGSTAIHERANRIWAIKGDTLYFSDIANIDSWPAANKVQFPGEALVAIGDCGPYIVLFGYSHIWFIYDFDTAANRLVTSTHGILTDPNGYHSRAFASTESGVFFHDGQDFFHLDSSETLTRIGDPIKPLGTPSYTSMVYDGRWLYVNFIDNKIAVYDTRLKSWWLQGIRANAIARHSRGMAIGPDTGAINVWSPELINPVQTENITAYWTKTGMDFGSGLRKRVRLAQIIGDSGIDSVTFLRDGTSIARTPTFASSQARMPNIGVAREWGVTIQGTDTAVWECNEMVFWLQGRKD